jgi:hypothetical protein
MTAQQSAKANGEAEIKEEIYGVRDETEKSPYAMRGNTAEAFGMPRNILNRPIKLPPMVNIKAKREAREGVGR